MMGSPSLAARSIPDQLDPIPDPIPDHLLLAFVSPLTRGGFAGP